MGTTHDEEARPGRRSLSLSERASRAKRLAALATRGVLFAVTASSAIAVLFIVAFILKDALPFFRLRGIAEFFGSTRWYPSAPPPEFGALALFVGSGIVTLGAIVVAVPLGLAASLCLSDVLPFALRQIVKPIIEVLAAIPSVAYGFFALVVFAPLLQEKGGHLLTVAAWAIGLPMLALVVLVVSDLFAVRWPERVRLPVRLVAAVALGAAGVYGLLEVAGACGRLEIPSGTNALNVSIILGIMALPTIVSVSEDALQAVGRELREGSYALGATRAETLTKVVIPAARSGILAAVILGVMRALGETMVVWMASGNAARIPSPWYDLTQPVRTMTATIAGDMGEAEQVTGAARFHVLFALALCLLIVALLANLASEWIVRRAQAKLRGR
ncbi:MAG: phosphate ABC transporter permease subunit PstC [Verrucomicrobia bacterium]|nr:phosphate ABC transporter permease subunit PstC [Verrucomicrobiota bacterium]